LIFDCFVFKIAIFRNFLEFGENDIAPKNPAHYNYGGKHKLLSEIFQTHNLGGGLWEKRQLISISVDSILIIFDELYMFFCFGLNQICRMEKCIGLQEVY
jgi:hypothetical protein